MPPFVWGRPTTIFKHFDLFHSFHAIVKVQFGGLARLDRATNNYKDNLNSLYRHLDFTLTIDKALRNILVSAYSHYIDSWPMNGACVGHHTILMCSLLQFALHYGRYRRRQRQLKKEAKKKGPQPTSSIDLATLLDDEEENLKLRQINVTHVSIMDLLGDPGNPLYAETAQHGRAL